MVQHMNRPRIPRRELTPALELRGIQKIFKTSGRRNASSDGSVTSPLKVAVQDISLTAYPGEITVLLGSNGAGKTTTLACAQGLIAPDAGEVRVLGQDPWRADAQLRARVGIMLQDGGLPQSVRPIELLRHIHTMYARPKDVNELVHRLGIDTFARTTVRRLSGGQKQRVALAAALMGNPQVLFLDEPSAGLDPQSRQVVFDIISEERDKGTAIILTTHLLDDAQRLADYVYIVHAGTNVIEGTVTELLQQNTDDHQVLRLGLQTSDLTVSDLLPQHGHDFALHHERAGRYALSGPFTPEILSEVFATLSSAHRMPSYVELAPRTLEDVYLDISGRDIR